MKKNTDEGWKPYRLVILVQITLFLHAQNDRLCLGLIETCYFGPEDAVLHAKTTGGVYSPGETCNSSPKGAVLHAQNHR